MDLAETFGTPGWNLILESETADQHLPTASGMAVLVSDWLAVNQATVRENKLRAIKHLVDKLFFPNMN